MSAERPDVTYGQKARPAAFAVTYTLKGHRLVIDSGRKMETVPLDAVTSVRLTYDPRSFAQRAYETTLTLNTGRRIRFSSIHWKSMIEAATQPGYGAFVREVISAVADANPRAALACGKPRPVWLAVVGLTMLSLIAVVAFIGRALATGSVGAAGLGAAIGVAGVWQLEPMVRLNRPRVFAADAIPGDLLP